MIELQTKFKQSCFELFGEEGTKVYEFYKSLKSSKQSREDKYMTITERRIRSVTFLVEHYGKHSILEAITYAKERKESGTLPTNTINYFNNLVKKLSTSKPQLQQKTFEPLLLKVVPIKTAKVGSTYEDDIYNWIYQCSGCKEQFDAWTDTCPRCKAAINWKAV